MVILFARFHFEFDLAFRALQTSMEIAIGWIHRDTDFFCI